jgi:hypothetical protein
MELTKIQKKKADARRAAERRAWLERLEQPIIVVHSPGLEDLMVVKDGAEARGRHDAQ